VTTLLRGKDVGNEAITSPDCIRIRSSREVLIVTKVNVGNNSYRKLIDLVSQSS
jgi:hypothetical protein